jgi:hypothetical protein
MFGFSLLERGERRKVVTAGLIKPRRAADKAVFVRRPEGGAEFLLCGGCYWEYYYGRAGFSVAERIGTLQWNFNKAARAAELPRA